MRSAYNLGMRVRVSSIRRRSVSRGDLLITDDAFPSIDTILDTNKRKQLRFSASAMTDYLRLLESVVLYERIVVADCQIQSNMAEAVEQSRAWHLWTGRISSRGKLRIHDGVQAALASEGVLVKQPVSIPGSSTRQLFERQFSISPILRRLVKTRVHEMRNDEPDPKLREEVAFLSVWTEIGEPLYVSEAALQSRVPFLLAPWEVHRVQPIETFERRVHADVIASLRDRFAGGASAELEKIAAIGGRTIYPSSPIAWQIVSASTSVEDLCTVALQLRREYASLRQRLIEIDTELQAEGVSVARKARIARELDALTEALWPSARRTLRKETIEVASVIGALPLSTTAPITTFAKIVGALASKPVDTLLEIVSRRRYRVLFRAKREFLKGAFWSQKLADILNVDSAIVVRGCDDVES